MDPVDNAPLIVVEPHAMPLDWRELWASRELLQFLVWRELKLRYKQTLIGVTWAVIQPLLALLILAAVFGRAARLPSEGVPYPLFAYAGLLVWTFFANALFSSSNSLIGSASLITKVYFPRLLLPVSAVLARLVDLAISCVLLAVLMAYYRVGVTWRLLMLPPVIAIAMLLALGAGMVLAALSVRYRDASVALPHAMQFLMFATPVFYSATMLPRGLRRIADLNPIAVVIDASRASLFGRVFHPAALAACAAATLLLLSRALVFFRTMEEDFADVV